MNLNQSKSTKHLRTGYTTGTYAATLALSAWLLLRKNQQKRNIEIQFPDNSYRIVPIDKTIRINSEETQAWATKDAGDDPDITNKAQISVILSNKEDQNIGSKDFVIKIKNSQIIICGGEGIGVVSRKGLEVEPGKWAINPIPRKMIINNLIRNGFGNQQESIKITISIERGEILAKRTLNPIIGINGGLSILGTSGIVYPISNKAYVKTIEIMLEGVARAKENTVALVTGGRTHRWVQQEKPNLPEYTIVRIGDFIHQALTCANTLKIPNVIVGCMFGKLAKYALGHMCTHAHNTALNMNDVADLLLINSVDKSTVNKAGSTATVKGFLGLLDKVSQIEILQILGLEALKNFNHWAPNTSLTLLIYDIKGHCTCVSYK